MNQSLSAPYIGCYGAFGMTDYYEAFEREAEQGINIVKAAKSAKLKHLIQRYADKFGGEYR